MPYEQDYIMRLIKQMIHSLRMVLFHKKEEPDYPRDANASGGSEENELFALADAGRIDEAENRLYDLLDGKDTSKLHLALLFYEHINDYPEDFLLEHGFSREEVLEGVKNAADMYGVKGLAETLMA